MKTISVLSGAALMLAVPLSAQPSGTRIASKSSEAEATETIASLFKAEPLTAEQRARLPQAEAPIAQIMPPGTLQQVMGGMFDRMLGPIMNMAGSPGSGEIAAQLGIEDEEFELAEEEAAQVAAILDPVWKQRSERQMKAMQSAMGRAMGAMEPAMRKGMAEAYTVTFTAPEMSDIAAFFATPSGATFARKSYALTSDPRIMAASMEALPALMSSMKDMEGEMKAAAADLPPKRGFADLTPAERATLSRLTGQSPAELRSGMARAAESGRDDREPDDET